jgi:hypothetical protein
VKKKDGTASVKRFAGRDEEWIHLQGWLEPDNKGVQKPYNENIAVDVIEQVAVVAIIRRRA